MADLRKSDPVRVAFDAVYLGESDSRPDLAIVVLPGTDLDHEVLITSRFLVPASSVQHAGEPAIDIPREVLEPATRALHPGYDRAAPPERSDAREIVLDALLAAAAVFQHPREGGAPWTS